MATHIMYKRAYQVVCSERKLVSFTYLLSKAVQSKMKISDDICDFGRILKTECNLKHFSRTTGLKSLNQLEGDLPEIYLWRAGLSEERNNVLTICNHHEQVFGKVFERKEKKC